MAKNKFQTEFEINASKKMLYPYIYTPSGLAQWLADDVNINEDKEYNFIWEEEDHRYRMSAHRTNSFVKFESIDNHDEDPNYFEIRLEMNELTQSVFIRVVDYSDNPDDEELQDLWESMVFNLKEIVGG
jgi:uncharacterized protein YndB with AHSA1/START domain